MKISLFSDFHFGISKNSTEKVEVGEQVMDNYAKIMDSLGVKEVIFCGDFFHSRDFLSTIVLYRARLALESFAKHFDKVHMIVGNHDMSYKHTNDINSIEQFGLIPNVTVYKDYTELLFGNKNFAFCPWDTLPDKNSELGIDAAFGHFAFSGAALVGAVSSGDYTMDSLTKVTPLVFSGHFHIRKEYATPTGKVVTIGCPYEQNWGDIGNSKGFYTIDTETLEYEFHENTFSPRHIPIRWSKIKKFDTNTIKNNYVKLIIDSDYEYEDVVKVMQGLSRAGSRSVEPDYQFQKELSNIQTALGDVTLVSHEEAINIYIDKMEISTEEKDWIRPIAIAKFIEKTQ